VADELPEKEMSKAGDTWGAYRLDEDGWWRLNPDLIEKEQEKE